VEGIAEAVAGQVLAIAEVCKAHSAREVRTAKDDCERELLWKGRKTAFGALGRLAPSNYVLDAVIPRSKLPQALRRVSEIGKEYDLKIGNIFHAGDGNLHPLVLFDPRDRKQFERAVQASEAIVRYCVEIGGALTGEHGVGMEKNELMTLMFTDADFALMRRVHSQFNPTGLLNPGKVFPGQGLRRNSYSRQPHAQSGGAGVSSTMATSLAARFEKTVGAAHVKTAADSLAGYRVDRIAPQFWCSLKARAGG
jgi:glycolate oxidase